MKRLALAIAAVALAGSASAATSSSSFNNAFQTTEIAQVGTLNKFNTGLGTLISATFVLDSSIRSSYMVQNNAAQSQTAEVLTQSDLHADSTNAELDALLVPFSLIVMQTTTGPNVYAAGQTINFGPLQNDYNFGPIALTNLADLLGPGTFDVSCSTLSNIQVFGGGGNISSMQQTEARCGGTVEYTYEANGPEPASLGFVGLGLAAAGLLARRRAVKA